MLILVAFTPRPPLPAFVMFDNSKPQNVGVQVWGWGTIEDVKSGIVLPLIIVMM